MENKSNVDNEKLLLYAAKTRKIEILKRMLSCLTFDFIPLAQAYAIAIKQAEKISPHENIRRTIHKEVEKVREQREIALDKIANQFIITSKEERDFEGTIISEQKTMTLKQAIDEPLANQAQLYSKCAQIIYAYLEPSIKKANNANILFLFLAQTGNLNRLQNFVDQYTDFINWNCCEEEGNTALHIAAQEGNLSIVEYLLHKNANCNAQTYYAGNPYYQDMTPLHYAVKNHHLDIVQCLLNNGCDPNIHDFFGDLPLHYVAPGEKGNQEIFETLITAGTNIDSIDKNGKTMLYKAVENDWIDAVEYLLSLGANPLAKQYIGDEPDFMQTPLALAKIKTHTNICARDKNIWKNNKKTLSLMMEKSAEALLNKYKKNTTLT
jgi:hypothetical protein